MHYVVGLQNKKRSEGRERLHERVGRLVPSCDVSTHCLISSSNSVLEIVADKKACKVDQYLGALEPSPALSLALMFAVDSKDIVD